MRQVSFFVDDRHSWLDETHPTWSQTNIGSDGSNLTLVFLSMNRASLSERLVRSLIEQVPGFAGRILVVDNGSDPAELAALTRFFTTECPFPYEILELGQNHGVAGGRNRGFAAVRTDWILSLDNDILLTGNPLPQLARDLATLGCHFLSVPLLNPDRATFYSYGGHLDPAIIDGSTPFLSTACMLPPGADLARAAEVSPSGDGFLCSFLFGGASLLKATTFTAAGGFDDAMLVGFEDIEFSLRLFRLGYKVGSSSITDFVHDHPRAERDSDLQYESTRYSRQILRESAAHFERKHGFRVWSSGIDAWLRGREQHQGLVPAGEGIASAETKPRVPVRRTPRIALVVDMENWAYANIARQLTKHLGHRYDFEILSTHRLGEIEQARWADAGHAGTWQPGGPQAFGQILLRAHEFDLVHVFWRPLLTLLGDQGFYGSGLADYVRFLGLSMDEFRIRFIAPACFTTSVYDHLFADGEEAELMAEALNRHATAYTVSSDRLALSYARHEHFRPPAATIPDGVDPELFYPKNLARFDELPDRALRVGWVGNSHWMRERDSKGVHTILIPAIAALRMEGLAIELDLADRAAGFIPHAQMVDYYARLDVLVCTSEVEGTPNPVLEALACGVPIVSTDVGVVPDALGPLQQDFILSERSVPALTAALGNLARRPELFRQLSQENLRQSAAWTWQHQTTKFHAFFAEVLDRRRVAAGETPTKLCMLPFTTPSQEPDGSIRLCSAASTLTPPYREATNMGNARADGLAAVWRGHKYRHVRETLLAGGDDLTPYCRTCEYRHDGPAWLLQLHTALHAYHNGIRSPELTTLLSTRISRYDEYVERAKLADLAAYPRPEDLTPVAPARVDHPVPIPEAILDGGAFPINLDLNTLNRCNVSCVMCPPAIRIENGQDRDEYYRLTVDEYDRLSDNLNIKSAHFVGAYAEPLLNKDLFDLVKTAHDRGAFTAITTNAMPLVPAFSRRLIEAGLDMMSISLHGATRQTAEAIMLKSNFERVIDNIRCLQSLKLEKNTTKPEIYFNFVSQLQNVDEIADFIDLAADLNVKHVQIIHLIDGDEAVDRSTNLVHHPERLLPNLRRALERGSMRNVHVNISPAYAGLLEADAANAAAPPAPSPSLLDELVVLPTDRVELCWETEVPCPVCASRDVDVLRQDQIWGYQFVSCRNCTTRYYDRRMSERYVINHFLHGDGAREEAINLYENGVMVGEPHGTPDEQKRQLETYYAFLLDLQTRWYRLANHGRDPVSLFEIGTSVGWFLHFARQSHDLNGTTLRVAGCDANPYAAKVGRSRLNLDLFAGIYQDYDPINSLVKYDLITALDYIEHTYTPLEDLKKMYNMANTGAVLFIKTFIEEMDPNGTYVHPVFHANHFSERSLKLAIEKAGWEVLEFDTERERVFAQASVFAVKR
ncbi:GTP 3',8-cyclase [Methylobacterium haplocladii]|nr:GTP 3',8-cyclase [Methylobacterium haplocladii]